MTTTREVEPRIRELLGVALALPNAVPRIGRAIWLYVLFVSEANSSGHICRTEERLSEALGITPARLHTWLQRLEEAALIEIHSPAPYLVLKLRFWSGSKHSTSNKTPMNSRKSIPSHREVPVSSSKLQAAAAGIEKQQGEGGPGEGDELIREACRILEVDAKLVRPLRRRFDDEVIRKALDRVAGTPAGHIRKSRYALFRYLLNEFTEHP